MYSRAFYLQRIAAGGLVQEQETENRLLVESGDDSVYAGLDRA